MGKKCWLSHLQNRQSTKYYEQKQSHFLHSRHFDNLDYYKISLSNHLYKRSLSHQQLKFTLASVRLLKNFSLWQALLFSTNWFQHHPRDIFFWFLSCHYHLHRNLQARMTWLKKVSWFIIKYYIMLYFKKI